MNKLKIIFTAIGVTTLVACAPATVSASATASEAHKAEQCGYVADFGRTVAMWKDNGVSERNVLFEVEGWEEFQNASEKDQVMVKEYIGDVYYWDWSPDEAFTKIRFRCYNYDY